MLSNNIKPETPLEKLVFGLIFLATLVIAGFLAFRPFPGIAGALLLLLLAAAVIVATSWMAKRRKAGSR